MTLSIWAGMGMKKNKFGSGTGYHINFNCWSGMSPLKTLPENTCITGEVIHGHKGFDYVSTTTSNFPWPQKFSAFLSYDELQIN